MSPAFEATFWGFVSGGALVLGAAVGYFASVPGRVIAGIMAFGSGVSRILKIPEPKCFVLEYGDSTVNLELRVWIDDPKNGIDDVEDAVLMAIWQSFHANGITIAFPQSDLHIKSVVPLEIKSGP